MGSQRLTALMMLLFLGAYGSAETALCALAPVRGVNPVAEACPPEILDCEMHPGEPCCCEPGAPMHAPDSQSGEVPFQFAASCAGADKPLPPPLPHSPFFRYLLPEQAPTGADNGALEAATEETRSPLEGYSRIPTPPPQRSLT